MAIDERKSGIVQNISKLNTDCFQDKCRIIYALYDQSVGMIMWGTLSLEARH